MSQIIQKYRGVSYVVERVQNKMLITPKQSFNDKLLEKIDYQLNFAQQKLIVQSIPWQLRTFSYLRIGCNALHKYHQIQGNYSLQTPYGTSYLKLLKLLSTCNVQWWNKCSINSDTTIKSDCIVIAQLLQPINDFYKFRGEVNSI